MPEFLFYKEAPVDRDTEKYQTRWVLKKLEGSKIFFLRHTNLSGLTQIIIAHERAEIRRANLATLAKRLRINEHYEGVPCTPEEIDELLRIYKKIREGKRKVQSRYRA